MILTIFSVWSQTRYRPGDVNGSNKVNYVDILLWSIARAEYENNVVVSGDDRVDKGTDFDVPVLLSESELWPESFPLDNPILNFAFADCNGDGVIDERDSTVIADNYSKSIIPSTNLDGFVEVTDLFDNPLLRFNPDENLLRYKLEEELRVELVPAEEFGENDPNSNAIDGTFWGIGFRVQYEPTEIDPSKGLQARFELLDDSSNWIGKQGEEADVFIWEDTVNWTIDVAIYRINTRLDVTETDFGTDLGNLVVVTEELIFQRDSESRFNFENIKFVNESYKQKPVVTGELIFEIFDDPDSVNSIVDQNNKYIKVFPVPADNELDLQVNIPGKVIDRVVLNSLDGVQLFNREIGSAATSINLSSFSTGVFLLKVYANDQVYIRLIQKIP